LSKTLLCGVLATSFLIINCQKAPTRGVKAGGGADPNAKLTAVKVGDCSPPALAAIKARSDAAKALADLIKAKPTDDTGKKALDAAAVDLDAKNTAAVKAITDIKVGKDSADACKTPDPADAKKSIQYLIGDLNAENKKLGAMVKDITGNSTPSMQASASDLNQGDMLTISNELAQYMTDNKGCIMAGKIAAAADCEAALKNTAVTLCTTTSSDSASYKGGDVATISANDGTLTVEAGRSKASMALAVKADLDGNRAVLVNCTLADSAKGDSTKAKAEIKAALGALVKKMDQPAAPASPSTPSQPGTPSTPSTPANPSTPSTPSTPDSTVTAAQTALELLNSKLGK